MDSGGNLYYGRKGEKKASGLGEQTRSKAARTEVHPTVVKNTGALQCESSSTFSQFSDFGQVTLTSLCLSFLLCKMGILIAVPFP